MLFDIVIVTVTRQRFSSCLLLLFETGGKGFKKRDSIAGVQTDGCFRSPLSALRVYRQNRLDGTGSWIKRRRRRGLGLKGGMERDCFFFSFFSSVKMTNTSQYKNDFGIDSIGSAVA